VAPSHDDGSQRLLPRPVLVIAAVLAGTLLGVVVVVGLLYGSGSDSGSGLATDRQTLALPRIPAPKAGSAECAALAKALPERLDNGRSTLARRQLARPAPPATVAWGAGSSVVLRCGLAEPGELTPTSALLEVSTVRWLRVPGDGATTWYAVDRPVYIALTVPDGFGTGSLQETSTTIRKALPPVPVHP
jgi:Protein of unknown function (DUF3515)